MVEHMTQGEAFRPNFDVPTRNEIVAVGASSVNVCLKRNGENRRLFFLIRNTSDDVTKIITLHLGQSAAVVNAGIVLRQNESYLESTDKGFECHQDGISAICAVAAGQLSVVER